MNRTQAADALARVTAFWSALFAEAEDEARALREEVAQLRAAHAQERAARVDLQERDTAEALGSKAQAERLTAEVEALRRGLDAKDAELADYEQTVGRLRLELTGRDALIAAGREGDARAAERTGELRAQLRVEEARSASYQSVDAAARRFVRRAREVGRKDCALALECDALDWDALRVAVERA